MMYAVPMASAAMVPAVSTDMTAGPVERKRTGPGTAIESAAGLRREPRSGRSPKRNGTEAVRLHLDDKAGIHCLDPNGGGEHPAVDRRELAGDAANERSLPRVFPD